MPNDQLSETPCDRIAVFDRLIWKSFLKIVSQDHWNKILTQARPKYEGKEDIILRSILNTINNNFKRIYHIITFKFTRIPQNLMHIIPIFWQNYLLKWINAGKGSSWFLLIALVSQNKQQICRKSSGVVQWISKRPRSHLVRMIKTEAKIQSLILQK